MTVSAAFAALLSILGVVVGALLQSHLGRRSNAEKQLLESRNEAYVEFLEAVSLVVAALRMGKKEQELEQIARLTHAKARIAIFGEELVIRQLAEFWRVGASFETESELLAFTRFCLRIRESLGLKDKEHLSAEVSQLLFSVKPPSG